MSNLIKNENICGIVRCSQKGGIHLVEGDEQGLFNLLGEERTKAYQMGRDEGEKVGYEKAKEEMSAFLHLLQTLIGKLLEEKEKLYEGIKPEIIEFALAVSERLIRIELSQPEKLAKLIENFIHHATSSFQGENLKIYLSPEDLVMLESRLQKINYDKREIKGLKFFSDPLQKRGDVRIETKGSLLNFVLSREIEDLRSKILRQ
jgi:flagellar biosynthesis/type III secretory pathway protein FliH